MLRIKTYQDLFKRYRRPGDLVFAVIFLAFAVFLVSQLGNQTTWVKRTSTFQQPAFWPTVSLITMTSFAALHLLGSVLSPKIEGRWTEVAFWLRSLEYVAWFLAYVALVPILGYLIATILAGVALALRSGYRSGKMLVAAAVSSFAIVFLFKTMLQVKVPGGAIYEYLPTTLRAFMLTYF